MRSSIQVLDHGYLSLVDSWGSDEAIIEAARMSTAKGFQGWGPVGYRCTCGWEGAEENCKKKTLRISRSAQNVLCCPACENLGVLPVPGDEKLLRYLWEHKHATPFEMAGLTIEVQAPIFVFREWHRHRTQSYNEMSARYVPLPDVNYVPSVERLMQQSASNKQASSTGAALTAEKAEQFRCSLAAVYEDQELLYQSALADGVPKELARVHLPVGRYSRMRASANLRNWLGFLTLRLAPNAQWEIRQYAEALGGVIALLYPRTWSLFEGSR